MDYKLTQKQRERIRRPPFIEGYMPEYRYLYVCKDCGHHYWMHSDCVWQTILWSDGVTEEEYPYARYPDTFMCEGCKEVKWQSRLEEVDSICLGTDPHLPKEDMPWKELPRLREPTLREYRRELRTRDFGYGIHLEDHIRKRIWQKWNNRFRPNPNKGVQRLPVELSNGIREILNDLHPWMNESNTEKALLKAEMLRQLGRFKLSQQLVVVSEDFLIY